MVNLITNVIVTDSFLDAEQSGNQGRYKGNNVIRRKARRYQGGTLLRYTERWYQCHVRGSSTNKNDVWHGMEKGELL